MPPRPAVVRKFGCFHSGMLCGLASRVREEYECALLLKESVFPGAGLGLFPSRDNTHCNVHNIQQQGVTLFGNTGAHCGPDKHIRNYNGSIVCGECFKDTNRAAGSPKCGYILLPRFILRRFSNKQTNSTPPLPFFVQLCRGSGGP